MEIRSKSDRTITSTDAVAQIHQRWRIVVMRLVLLATSKSDHNKSLLKLNTLLTIGAAHTEMKK
jgi:hypothetical protein